MQVRLSLSSALLVRHWARLLGHLRETHSYVRLRALHSAAPALWWALATDGPFGNGNATVAMLEVQRLYRHHGWELRASEDLYDLAEATAAGLVAEEDVASQLHEQVHPRPRLSRRWGPFRR